MYILPCINKSYEVLLNLCKKPFQVWVQSLMKVYFENGKLETIPLYSLNTT